MSLNRCEQHLFDHLETHREEGQYWRQKVQNTVRSVLDIHEAARLLELDLWTYFVEKASQTGPFATFNPAPDLRRTSMRNLAEYLIRLWAPRPARRINPGSS